MSEYFQQLYDEKSNTLLISLDAIAQATSRVLQQIVSEGDQIGASVPEAKVIYAPDIPVPNIICSVSHTEIGDTLDTVKLPLHYIVACASKLFPKETITELAITLNIPENSAAMKCLDRATVDVTLKELFYQASLPPPTLDKPEEFLENIWIQTKAILSEQDINI